jgi:hypothetical protein
VECAAVLVGEIVGPSRLIDTKLLAKKLVVVMNVDGGCWEVVAVQTSLLTVLVFAIGLAHLSSPQKFQQWLLARHAAGSPPRVSDVMAEMSSDGTYLSVNSAVSTNCPFVSSDEQQSCRATVLSCERSLAEYQTIAAVEMRRAASSARPTLTNCTESIAINSLTIDSGLSASVCS